VITGFILIAAVAFFLGGVVGSKKPTVFFRPKEALAPKQLEAGERQHVDEWKKTFREVVIASEGSVSPALEVLLGDEEVMVASFLANARVVAETDKSRLLNDALLEKTALLAKAEADAKAILKKAEDEKAALLKTSAELCLTCGEPHPVAWACDVVLNGRKPLIGAALAEYEADREVCTPGTGELRAVRYRWHAKGYRFPRSLRATLIKHADFNSRADMRKMFDEQDTPPAPVEKKSYITPHLDEPLCVGCRHEAIWHGVERNGCCLRTHCRCAIFQREPSR
jgi:hypothetical protein